MRLFGSLKELVSAVFRKDTKEITLQPNALVYNQNQDLRLPPATDGSGDLTADTLVGAAAQQTLTNKTIDGDNNTLQDVGISSLKTVLADANKALVRNASGAVTSALIGNSNVGTGIDAAKIADGSVSNAEFQYLGNVTSDLQNQLNNKQPLDSDLTAIAALSANGLIARTGAGTAEARTLTAGSSKVAVTNGDGVSGNPTVDVTEANLSLNNISGTLNLDKGGTGQVTKDAAFSALSPTTTVGDLIVHKSLGGAANRLPVGPANYVLKSDGTEPGYGLITNSSVDNAAAIVDTKLATISTAGKVSGSAITSGTIGGSTVINTSGHITTTGNVNANNITVDNGSISTGVNKSVNIFNDATNTTIGTVASSSFYNIGTGSTTSGNTKTVNIGNGGLAGSTTNVAIGSAAGSGTITLAENVTLGKLTTAGAVQVDSSGVTSSGILPASSGGTGQNSTATFPSSGVVVTQNSTDTLLNKTTISSTSAATGALTLPAGTTAQQPTAVNGMVRYNTDNSAFEGYASGSWSAIGGGGAGELNIVINPDGDTSLNGSRTNGVGDWVDSGTGTTSSKTTTAAEIPLSPSKKNAIKLLNAGSGTGYTRMRMTLPQSLYNRKLKLAWEQAVSSSPAYASGDYKIELYSNASADYSGAYTRISLSTDSSSVSAIPALTGKYQTTFDTSTAQYLELRIVRVAGSTNSYLSLNNVIVGPGIQPQGAVVGGWQTVSGATISGGLSATTTTRVARSGSMAKFEFTITAGATPGTYTTLDIVLPSGYTLDSTSMNTTQALKELGRGKFKGAGGSGYWEIVGVYQTSTSIRLRVFTQLGANTYLYESSATEVTSSVPIGISAGDQYVFTTDWLPIAEWAGSGTVQLAQNDVEYASNDGSGGTAANTDYTTGSVAGPIGSRFVAIAASATNNTGYAVNFTTPIQVGDRFDIEISSDYGVTFQAQASAALTQRLFLAGAQYGVWIEPRSTNSIWVRFGDAGRFPTNAAGSLGAGWGDVTGAQYRWRVRKSSAGAAVGFGIVNSQSAGLLPSTNGGLDDATATRLGLKQYLHGTTYSGGNAPTVTSAQAGFAVSRATFVPYQMQDGTWRLKLNINASFTTATLTTYSLSINGITTSSSVQSVTSSTDAGTGISPKSAFIANSSNTISVYFASFSESYALISGDIELVSKPTWAY